MRTLVPMAITISARAMMILSIIRHLLCYRIVPNLLRTSEQQGKSSKTSCPAEPTTLTVPKRETKLYHTLRAVVLAFAAVQKKRPQRGTALGVRLHLVLDMAPFCQQPLWPPLDRYCWYSKVRRTGPSRQLRSSDLLNGVLAGQVVR